MAAIELGGGLTLLETIARCDRLGWLRLLVGRHDLNRAVSKGVHHVLSWLRIVLGGLHIKNLLMLLALSD